MIDQTLISKAIYTTPDTHSIIPVYSAPRSCKLNTIPPNNTLVEYSQDSNIQYVLVDYEYYTSKQKENPAFWDNITKASTEADTIPKH